MKTFSQRQFFRVIAGLSLITFIATAATALLLYRAAYREKVREIEKTTEMLAALMESVAQFDKRFSAATHPEGSLGATMSQIEQALQSLANNQEVLLIGRKDGDRIQVLRSSGTGLDEVANLPADDSRAQPLARALGGAEGSGEFSDYQGTPVLAAYAPVPTLGIGIVYQVEFTTMRAPYVRAATGVFGIYLFTVALLGGGYALVANRYERRTRENEEKITSIYDVAPIPIVLRDALGKIRYVNKALESLTGWSAPELQGRNWFKVFPPENARQEAQADYARQWSGGAARSEPLPILTRSGEERMIEWHSQVVRGRDGVDEFLSIGIDATEKRLADKALKESEARYRRAEQGTNDGLWEWDIVTGADYFSPRWLAMLGYAEGELRPHVDSFVDLIHPEDKPGVWSAVDRHLKDGEKFDVEMRLRTRSGDYLWVRSRGQAERDDHGRPFRMTGSITDESLRKQAESALQQERDRLRQVLDSQFGFVCLLTPEGVVTEINQAPLDLMNLKRAEAVGRDFMEIGWLESTSKEIVKTAIQRAVAGETSRQDILAQFPAKGTRDVDAVFSPLRDSSGNVSAVIGFGIDITERKDAERTLRESELILSEAQRIAKIGSWELELTTNRLHWSDEIFRLFEIDQETFAASYEAFLNSIHPDDRAEVNAAYTNSLSDRKPYRIVHRLLMADGRIKHVEEQCETDFDGYGRPIRSRGTVQDVTEHVKAEELIRQSLREKEILLREIHHRVKNNLQLISSLLYFQVKKVSDIQSLQVFEDVRKRLQSIILVHEKLYNSDDLSLIDFGDYARTLSDQLLHSAPASSQRIAAEMDIEPVKLPIEKALPLSMVLVELLTNVAKYAYPTGPAGKALVTIRRQATGVRMTVCDEGVGFPADFDPEKTRSFGWQLIRTLALQLGATISFPPGTGACVALECPMEEV